MSWAWWLAAPAGATAIVAVAVWWLGRPARAVSTDESMQSHNAYLAALVVPARGVARVEPVDLSG
ncbi:MAG: hypothetical protein M3O28_03000 [Actinomycetota bacterium]|nr:hypothetical protein [Actinomycetota bacterium]